MPASPLWANAPSAAVVSSTGFFFTRFCLRAVPFFSFGLSPAASVTKRPTRIYSPRAPEFNSSTEYRIKASAGGSG